MKYCIAADLFNHIAAGTMFADITNSYKCSICNADKSSFELTHKSW
ncbi:rubredoxin [Mucilaginibacter galii]